MANSIFSSSSVNPHFFKPMLPGFNTHLSIPEAFYSKHLEGRQEGNEAELRSDASEITWKIKIDGKRLTKGWEKFTAAHNLQVGDILVFRHEGNLVFHVTPFGPSCCEISYSHEEEDENNAKNKTGKLKKNPKHDTNFVVPVTASNLRGDLCTLPRGFTASSGLSKLCNEITLMDEKGRSMNLKLMYDKSTNRFRVKRGWRAFCCMNGHKAGCFLRLVLVGNGTKPVLRISPFVRNEDNSSFVVSVTVCNIGEDRLFLPVRFSRSNMFSERHHEISLMNRQGRTWTLSLKYRKSSDQCYITRGWRSFCEANGQKAGCSFLFKLVRNRTCHVLVMASEDSASEQLTEKKHSREVEESLRQRETGL